MRLNIHLDAESNERARRLAAGFRVPLKHHRRIDGASTRDAHVSQVVQWALKHLENLAVGGLFNEEPVDTLDAGPVEWRGGGEGGV